MLTIANWFFHLLLLHFTLSSSSLNGRSSQINHIKKAFRRGYSRRFKCKRTKMNDDDIGKRRTTQKSARHYIVAPQMHINLYTHIYRTVCKPGYEAHSTPFVLCCCTDICCCETERETCIEYRIPIPSVCIPNFANRNAIHDSTLSGLFE